MIHVPDYYGSFEMDIRSHILKRLVVTGYYEPQLLKLVKSHIKRNVDAIDVGANIGLYTVLFANLISPTNKVLAIEPIPSVLYYLHRNIKRNNLGNQVIFFEGVSKECSGLAEIQTVIGNEEYSSMRDIAHPSAREMKFLQITVSGETIDNLVKLNSLSPGFIKIDTEGAELMVLKGALRTLETARPVIISELSDRLLAGFNSDTDEVLSLLEGKGYVVIDVLTGHRPIKPFHGNIIALPK
ncbi:MAG: FkbM family methyltransferase [Candidatus Competibacteraceae bacterium]|nr:FkbM family methyltransferase [Candidatus Competibacteraceae bacterium]